MKNKHVVYSAILAGIINFILIVVLIRIAYKYYKIRINEFYHRSIIFFLLMAYIVRIVELIYVFYTEWERDYNDYKDKDSPLIRRLLVYGPITLHGVAGMSYLFRWYNYWIMTRAKKTISENKIAARILCLKSVYIIKTSLVLSSIILLNVFLKDPITMIVILLVVYMGSAIGLIVTSSYFLWILKANHYSLYRSKSRTIRSYTLIISIWMILRGSSTISDLIFQTIGYSKHPTLEILNDIGMMLWYFTELFPSIGILFVLNRSYQEMRNLRGTDSTTNTESKSSPALSSKKIHQFIQIYWE